jgi:hypothetical protein
VFALVSSTPAPVICEPVSPVLVTATPALTVMLEGMARLELMLRLVRGHDNIATLSDRYCTVMYCNVQHNVHCTVLYSTI